MKTIMKHFYASDNVEKEVIDIVLFRFLTGDDIEYTQMQFS